MSPRLPRCTPTEFERVLRKLGFVEDRQRGSHKVFVRASDDRTVVVPWHNRDLKRGTLHALVKGTGLTIDEREGEVILGKNGHICMDCLRAQPCA